MVEKDYYQYVEAHLKSQQGEVLATGHLTVNNGENNITFTSDFVPLFPMGTPMFVSRIFKNTEIHRFEGKVYISDKKLMRLVSVTDQLLPNSHLCYSANMEFIATATPCFASRGPEKFQWFFSKKQNVSIAYQIRIISITLEKLVFQFASEMTHIGEEDSIITPKEAEEIKQGDRFYIKTQEPISPKHITAAVVKPYYFGQKPCYVCNIVDMLEEDKERLNECLWQYNLIKNKAF